jgi:hypothetical protein
VAKEIAELLLGNGAVGRLDDLPKRRGLDGIAWCTRLAMLGVRRATPGGKELRSWSW